MKTTIIALFCLLAFVARAQVPDYGMTSPAHKNYVGQIVFSKSPIQFQNENPAGFTTDFHFPDDKIYFMAYFPKSIANRCHEEYGVTPGMANANITFTFFVNGQEAGSCIQGIGSDELNKWTGWSDPSNPFGVMEGYQPKYGFAFKDYVVPRLKKGVNEVKMVVGYKVSDGAKIYENKKPVTEGTMKIHMKNDYQKELKALPNAIMHDALLENKIQDALAYRWRKNTIVKKVILTEKEWRIETNALGVPLRKVLKVYAITSPKSGEYANTCYATPFEVKRKFIGNGRYSDEIIWYSSGGRPTYEVACH